MTTIVIAVTTGVAVLLAGNMPWAGFGPVAGLWARNCHRMMFVVLAVLTVWAYRKVHALRMTKRVSQLPIIASA